MESAANLARNFMRMSTISQDQFLEIVLDLMPADRRLRLFLKSTERDQATVSNNAVSQIESEVKPTTSKPNAASITSASGRLTHLRGGPGASTSTALTPMSPGPAKDRSFYALDVEYVETIAGVRLIHSMAMLKEGTSSPIFMIAKLPPRIQLKESFLLTPSIRGRGYTPHTTDINTLKATAWSIADISIIVMWDAPKDLSALDLPTRVEIMDLANSFKRSDGSQCSLRGIYFHFFGEDIYRNGRDPRNSVKAILRLHQDILPNISKFSAPGYFDKVVSNTFLNAMAASEDSCKISRRRR